MLDLWGAECTLLICVGFHCLPTSVSTSKLYHTCVFVLLSKWSRSHAEDEGGEGKKSERGEEVRGCVRRRCVAYDTHATSLDNAQPFTTHE